MESLNISRLDLTGFNVRTKNEDEMDTNTAKISHLWEIFYAQAAPCLTEHSSIYGVYCNYESGHNGEYDVFACSNTEELRRIDGTKDLEIQTGKYLKFSAKGEMPKAAIDLWGEIWRYFSSEGCSFSRAYTTDFEFYKSDNEVEISISIE